MLEGFVDMCAKVIKFIMVAQLQDFKEQLTKVKITRARSMPPTRATRSRPARRASHAKTENALEDEEESEKVEKEKEEKEEKEDEEDEDEDDAGADFDLFG